MTLPTPLSGSLSGHRRFASSALAALLLLALAACDDWPTTTTIRRIEDPWALVQGGGLLPVIVRGRPAFASDAAISDGVFRVVEGAITWTATPPVIRESPGDAERGRRLVFLFNADGADPCGDRPAGGDPRPHGQVSLSAGFCDGSEMLSQVDGRVGRSAGLDSRPLVRLIEQATRDLLAPPPAPRP